MRAFVDREDEVLQLRGAQASPPALVVIGGRRRIGKSALIAHALAGPRTVIFQADERAEQAQLAALGAELGRTLLGTDALRPRSWEEVFDLVEAQVARGPLTLVLDEFQWLKRSQPALDSIIQRYWDRWDRAGLAVCLVLSGSALSLMEGLLVANAPLFGRAVARPVLGPIDYRASAAFADTADPELLLRRYAILGGTPQYQVWAGRTADPARLLRDHVLVPGGGLYGDPLHLLREEEGIRDPGTYLSILAAIAGGTTVYNEIAQRAGIESGNLKGKLDRLAALGYVQVREPMSPKPSDRRRRAIYAIGDTFFRFWFRYVLPNRSRLEAGRIDEVAQEVEVDLDNFMGLGFEECAREWARRYADAALVGRLDAVGSWWSRDGRHELDIVGVHKERIELVGTCKWRRHVDHDVIEQLLGTQAVLGRPATRARRIAIAREGFSDQALELAREESVALLTAQDLFA